MKKQALSFTPPPGKAGVYIIRPYEYTGSVFLNEINFDYQESGSLGMDSYLFGIVPPGEHTLSASSSKAEPSEVVHFTAEADKNYYFTVRLRSSLVLLGLAPSKFLNVVEPASESKGQMLVRELKLSGDNRFELENPPGQAK